MITRQSLQSFQTIRSPNKWAGLIVTICLGIQTNQIGQSEWYGILLSETKVQFKVALTLFLPRIREQMSGPEIS